LAAKVPLLGSGGRVAIRQYIEAFVAQVRADRAAIPGIAGDGTALELLIAPSFQTLVPAKN